MSLTLPQLAFLFMLFLLLVGILYIFVWVMWLNVLIRTRSEIVRLEKLRKMSEEEKKNLENVSKSFEYKLRLAGSFTGLQKPEDLDQDYIYQAKGTLFHFRFPLARWGRYKIGNYTFMPLEIQKSEYTDLSHIDLNHGMKVKIEFSPNFPYIWKIEKLEEAK